MPSSRDEAEPLLPSSDGARTSRARRGLVQAAIFSVIAFLVIWLVTFRGFRSPWSTYEPVPEELPRDPLERARALLKLQPVIDGVCIIGTL